MLNSLERINTNQNHFCKFSSWVFYNFWLLSSLNDTRKAPNFLLLLFPTVINTTINEPPLPRRKKNPELAYRHHEFILDSSVDKTDSSITRARVSSTNIFCFLVCANSMESPNYPLMCRVFVCKLLFDVVKENRVKVYWKLQRILFKGKLIFSLFYIFLYYIFRMKSFFISLMSVNETFFISAAIQWALHNTTLLQIEWITLQWQQKIKMNTLSWIHKWLRQTVTLFNFI